MPETNPAVDAWIARQKRWTHEIAALRKLVLARGLHEDFKWAKPCYTHDGANVVLIMPLKETCTLLFVKGALMKDPAGVLAQAGENSQSQRQMRFTSLDEVRKFARSLQAYLDDAIAVEAAGLKVAFRKSSELVYPVEFQSRLDAHPALREAFGSLTPGRQRQYHLYFTGAKQAKTREARVEKCLPLILDGLGLDD